MSKRCVRVCVKNVCLVCVSEVVLWRVKKVCKKVSQEGASRRCVVVCQERKVCVPRAWCLPAVQPWRGRFHKWWVYQREEDLEA